MNLKVLKDKNVQMLIISIICVIFGVLFCVLAQTMLNFLQTVLCIILLLYGGFHLVSFCVIAYEDKQVSTFFHGIVPFAVGMLLIFVPSFFVNAFGAIVLVLEILRLIVAVKHKKQYWIINLIASIFFMIASIVLIVLCNVKINQYVVMVILGAILILEGIVNLSLMYAGKKLKPKTIEETKEPEVEQSLEEKSENVEDNVNQEEKTNA